MGQDTHHIYRKQLVLYLGYFLQKEKASNQGVRSAALPLPRPHTRTLTHVHRPARDYVGQLLRLTTFIRCGIRGRLSDLLRV